MVTSSTELVVRTDGDSEMDRVVLGVVVLGGRVVDEGVVEEDVVGGMEVVDEVTGGCDEVVDGVLVVSSLEDVVVVPPVDKLICRLSCFAMAWSVPSCASTAATPKKASKRRVMNRFMFESCG